MFLNLNNSRSDLVQILDQKTFYIPNFHLFVGGERGFRFQVIIFFYFCITFYFYTCYCLLLLFQIHISSHLIFAIIGYFESLQWEGGEFCLSQIWPIFWIFGPSLNIWPIFEYLAHIWIFCLYLDIWPIFEYLDILPIFGYLAHI